MKVINRPNEQGRIYECSSYRDDRVRGGSRNGSDRDEKRRSRSRDKTRERSRSRSRDDGYRRPSDRYDRDRDRYIDRARKSYKDDDSKDRKVKLNSIMNSTNKEDYDDNQPKKKKYEVTAAAAYEHDYSKEIDSFLFEKNVEDEIQEAERLKFERKKRREEILLKYNIEKGVIAPTGTAIELLIMKNKKNRDDFLINKEKNNSDINNLFNLEKLSKDDLKGVQLRAVTASPSSGSLAAMFIAENNNFISTNNTEEIDRYELSSNELISDRKEDAEVKGLTEGIIESRLIGISDVTNDNKGLDVEGDIDTYENENEEGKEDSVDSVSSSPRDNTTGRSSKPILFSKVTASSSSPSSSSYSLSSPINENYKNLTEDSDTFRKIEAHQHKETLPFDMFSASPSDVEKRGGRRALRQALIDGEGEDPHLQSNWDDGEGYYKPRIGEMFGEQYQTMSVVGKGVFSIVIKCIDIQRNSEAVAIKVIRNNDTMRKAAEKEKNILSLILDNDPLNKRHCVRLLAHFEFRNHVALVFDYQQMNLRETLKKFGKDVGINIGAVRMYSRQLFVALKHLVGLKIVHADIKLDNILCSGDLKQIKLCDFGSAFRESDTDNDPTPYLVSRFYRAPEIILGLPYDHAIDLWPVAVCMYELFTGHVMFPGRTNNEMLRLMMAIKGRIANKQLKSHFRSYEAMSLEPHFDERDFKFRQQELDPVTGKSVLRLVDITQPSKDLASVIRSSKAGADDATLVSKLADLLDKCLVLDPSKRILVSEALTHFFF